jgi:hypothetical protein
MWECGALKTGNIIQMKITLRRDNPATISLLTSSNSHDEVALRITLHGKSKSANFSACKNGQWDADETEALPQGFHIGMDNNIILEITCVDDRFIVRINLGKGETKDLKTWPHRHGFQLQHVNRVYFDGDMYLVEHNLS